VDAEKLARYARLDTNIFRPIAHRTVQQQEALTLVRARALLVRLRTAAVKAVRGPTKSCGYLVGTLRDTYGDDFAHSYRSDAQLGTVLDREGLSDLSELLKKKP
jgi:hypothetical protein